MQLSNPRRERTRSYIWIDTYEKTKTNIRLSSLIWCFLEFLHLFIVTILPHLNLGKSTSLGSLCKQFINRGLFSNIFSRGSVFICIVLKAGAQYIRELTCGIELLHQQNCAMGCSNVSGATTFGQAFDSVCSVDQLEMYCVMSIGATLCSNALGITYCVITTAQYMPI